MVLLIATNDTPVTQTVTAMENGVERSYYAPGEVIRFRLRQYKEKLISKVTLVGRIQVNSYVIKLLDTDLILHPSTALSVQTVGEEQWVTGEIQVPEKFMEFSGYFGNVFNRVVLEYFVRATLENEESTYEYPVVIRNYKKEDGWYPKDDEPINLFRFELFGSSMCCLPQSGTVGLNLKAPHTHCFPGDTLPCTLSLDNTACTSDIGTVEIEFNNIWIVSFGSVAQFGTSQILSETFTGVKAGDKAQLDFVIQIPQKIDPSSTISGMTNTYCIQVKMKSSSWFPFSAISSFALVIL